MDLKSTFKNKNAPQELVQESLNSPGVSGTLVEMRLTDLSGTLVTYFSGRIRLTAAISAFVVDE